MKKRRIHITSIIAIFVLTVILGALAISQLTHKTSSLSENLQNNLPKIQTRKHKTTPTFSPTPTIIPTPTPYTFQGLRVEEFYITFYGWPDNTPPGNEIAFPSHANAATIHDTTGGIGSYSNPITFASDPDYIKPGTIYYVPYLHKYVIMEDSCASCVKNWNNSLKHIDVWMDSDSDFTQELVQCQNKWTRRETYVVTQPTSNLPVDTTPIFDKQTGECSNYNDK